MFALLKIPVRSRRDVIWVRQRARRIASLLHFEGHEQALVAAAAFAIAHQGLGVFHEPCVHFQVESAALHIFVSGAQKDEASSTATLLHLTKPLPRQEFSGADLQWIATQIPLLEPIDLFREIAQQNQELLALSHALHVAQTSAPATRSTSAA